MKKLLAQLLVVFSLVIVAPAAFASISLEDQRIQVAAALDVVIDELEDDIADIEAQLQDPGLTLAEQRALQRALLILNGRLSFVESTQRFVPHFSAALLDRIILRYNLPVSLS